MFSKREKGEGWLELKPSTFTLPHRVIHSLDVGILSSDKLEVQLLNGSMR